MTRATIVLRKCNDTQGTDQRTLQQKQNREKTKGRKE